MDKKTWVVAANSTQARVFECETIHKWTEIETLVHTQSRLQNRDLASDRPGGMSQESVGKNRSSMGQPQSPKEIEIKNFAKQLARYLELARSQGKVERLFIAASPTFLGHLRSEMTPSLLQINDKTVDKDITLSKPEQMKEYFFIGV